jgi:DNA transformation protein
MSATESDLDAMTNLGRTTVHWLQAIGVRSRADLERVGIEAAFLAMRGRGFRVTRVTLYSLYGALNGTPWRQVSAADKARLNGALRAVEAPSLAAVE